MELSDIQRLYIQTIFDDFHVRGVWPVYGDVERKISQVHRAFDMRAVARSLPAGFANGFAFTVDRKQEAVLIVPVNVKIKWVIVRIKWVMCRNYSGGSTSWT